MTAIAAAWSPEGFAVAADGRQIIESPQQVIDDAQKIFATPFADRTGFAFAWFGAVSFLLNSGRRVDFGETTQCVMDELPEDAYWDEPEAYFGGIARRIFCELPTDVGLSSRPDASVIFVGYLNGRPLCAEIKFPHDDTAFLPPILTKLEFPPSYINVFAGSPTVATDMRRSGLLSQPSDLSEAAEMVRRYAQTCVDNSRVIPDCNNLGGHVHVATVTPEGFSWVIAPLA